MADRRIEGILISPVNQGPAFIQFLKELGVPIVCIGNYVSEDFSTVLIDEYRAARDAVQYIASKGYQRIIFVCPPLSTAKNQNVYSHIQRSLGVKDEVTYLDELTYTIIDSQTYVDDVLAQVKDTVERTAILCSGDIYALQIINVLKEQYSIPEQVGIMGFDNISVLQYVTPRLTTVSTSVTEVAIAAVRELISQVENSESIPKKIILNHCIIRGNTL